MQNYINTLQELKNNSCYRTIKNIQKKDSKFIIVDNKKMLNLSSNDYLGISTNKDLIQEFCTKYNKSAEFLFSSASARLLTGTSDIYKKLELYIAEKFNFESSLIFNSGYQCNQAIISTLFNKNDCIFSDKLNHASIVSGLKLSPAQHYRYRHNDYEHLEEILKKQRHLYNNALIVTESVYSMDGDIAPIKKLIELKNKYNCMLMVDEAHGFGVFGDNLLGVCEQLNVLGDIDIITITLGKAIGSQGAICLSNANIINYLINKASGFIFSTSLPPVSVLWTYFLLHEKFELLKQKKEKLNNLFNYAHKLLPTISSSQIIPVIIKDAEKTSLIAHDLQNKGFYILPINPPTVPKGTSRLRISLTSDIEKTELDSLFQGLKENGILLVK